MTSRRLTRRALAPLAVLGAAALVVAACSDDDDAASSAPPATAAAPAPAPVPTSGSANAIERAAGGAAGTQTVCQPYLDVTVAFNGEPDPATVTPLLDSIDAAAPAEIGVPLHTMTAAARSALASGGSDTSALESPEFTAAMGTVDPWVFAHCSFDDKLQVSATEYTFTGLPATLPAGRTGLLVTNQGHEAHALVIVRRAPGVTASWDELLALPEEEAQTKVEDVAGGFVPAHGASSLVVADLTPGDYLVFCPVSAGTHQGADGTFVEGRGAPHFTQGMRAELTVEG